MTDLSAKIRDDALLKKLRIVGWSLAGFIVALPAIAMATGAEGVAWGSEDFIVAAILLGSAGLVVEALVRTSRDWNHRAAAIIGTFATLAMIWSNLAVGIIGNENNPVNLGYMLLVPLLLVGMVVVRGRPRGLGMLMALGALWFVGVPLVAILTGAISSMAPGLVAIHLFFVTLYALAALLFARAAERG